MCKLDTIVCKYKVTRKRKHILARGSEYSLWVKCETFNSKASCAYNYDCNLNSYKVWKTHYAKVAGKKLFKYQTFYIWVFVTATAVIFIPSKRITCQKCSHVWAVRHKTKINLDMAHFVHISWHKCVFIKRWKYVFLFLMAECNKRIAVRSVCDDRMTLVERIYRPVFHKDVFRKWLLVSSEKARCYLLSIPDENSCDLHIEHRSFLHPLVESMELSAVTFWRAPLWPWHRA
jgi:hypothetical protein